MAKEVHELSIQFTPRGITFSGRIDSEETGQELANATKKIRPDLPIRNDGLRVDPSVSLPPLGDLKSLLAEIGLSSHEGGVAFFSDRVVLTGMTDSPVTLTAIQLRLEPILEGRMLVNRICIVSPADLPNIDVRLSKGESSDSLLDFDFHPTAAGAFVSPGVKFSKLYPTLVLMSSFERFVDPAALPQQNTLRAIPIPPVGSTLPDNVDLDAGPPLLRAIPSGPVATFVPLPSLRFSSNSFLLQAGGREALEAIAEQLSQREVSDQKVILKSLVWKGSSPDFVQYLAEKRAKEAKKHILSLGVPEAQVFTELVSISSAIDTGEVQVIVEIPPPPAPVETEEPDTGEPVVEENETETPTATGSE